jgi:poly(A) polymerase
MLRAVRLAAKLDFAIEPATRRPIGELAELVENIPPSRLFDEMLKLLTSGQAVKCVQQLRAEGLHHGLLPMLDVILDQPLGERFVMLALDNTDRRVREGKPISPGFLFATLLWHEVLKAWETRTKAGAPSQPALFEAMDEVLDTQARKLAITRRIVGDIKDIWALQPRFDKRTGKSPYRLIEQPRYRAGWDFLRLRAQSGEIPMDIPDWWNDFAHAGHEQRENLLRAAPQGGDAPAKKRRRRRRKPAAGGEDTGMTVESGTE